MPVAETEVLRGPEGRARFDAFVAAAAQPEFLQTWGWGDLKASTGWRPHRLLVRPAPGAAPVAACSLLERGLPGLGPLLYAPRGPIVAWERGAEADLALEAMLAFARARRAVVVKVDPGLPAERADIAAALSRHGFRGLKTGRGFEGVQPRFQMQLPLEGRDEAAVLAGMHPKTRYNIRLAARRGVRVREGGAADVAAFYAILTKTAQRDHFGVRDRLYFEAMWRCCLEPGQGWLLLAEADGRLLAGAIIFHVGRVAWYLYGAGADEGREHMAAYAVQWEAIRHALAEGCALYDFRGVSGDLREDNPLYGIYRFKKGFGANLVELTGEWDRPLRPLRYAVAERALPVARRALSALRRRGQGAPAPAE